MDATHLRHHIDDLRGRQRFLRTLKPETDRYKLWLGDFVEFVNVAYGPESPQMTELRALLVNRVRPPADAADAERERAYLEQLDRLAALLENLARQAPLPITFLDER